jgi:hypothetical protein
MKIRFRINALRTHFSWIYKRIKAEDKICTYTVSAVSRGFVLNDTIGLYELYMRMTHTPYFSTSQLHKSPNASSFFY